MNRSILLFLAGCLLTVDCSARSAPDAAITTGEDNPVIDALFAHWDQPGSPGCAIVVAQNGETIYSRGYGYANLDYNIPVTPQTVFDIASITKQFIVASLVMLELDGKLTLQDDVRKWLPELPRYEWPITLNHMIYHIAGLRNYLNLFPLAGRDDYYPISRLQILEMMSRQRSLVFQPGEDYSYSNTAYMLLAVVVERASGQALEKFLQERIFDPVGMADTYTYENFGMIMPNRATGYAKAADGTVRMTHNYNFDVVGDGQMYASMEDLLRWDQYLHSADTPPISPLMLTEGYLNDGKPIDRAKGLFLDSYRGLRTLHHTGSSWGTRSVSMRFREHGLAIAIACNDDNSTPRAIALKVADHLLADELEPLVEETPMSERSAASNKTKRHFMRQEKLEEFVGEYFSPELDAFYRLTLVDGQLKLRIEQQAPASVHPVDDDHFKFNFTTEYWSGFNFVDLDFQRDSKGSVSGFELTSGSERNIIFEKRPE